METCHPPGNGFFCRVVDTLDAEVAAEDAALAAEAEGVEVISGGAIGASKQCRGPHCWLAANDMNSWSASAVCPS